MELLKNLSGLVWFGIRLCPRKLLQGKRCSFHTASSFAGREKENNPSTTAGKQSQPPGSADAASLHGDYGGGGGGEGQIK